jgi:hypothetical protein
VSRWSRVWAVCLVVGLVAAAGAILAGLGLCVGVAALIVAICGLTGMMAASPPRAASGDAYLRSLDWGVAPECEVCGYDLQGLSDSLPCPECGAERKPAWRLPPC